MTKSKKEKKKTKDSLPNKNIHLRLAYLRQASSYLSQSTDATREHTHNLHAYDDLENPPRKNFDANSRYLVAQMKGIGRRSVIKLRSEVKRSVCKGCDQPLADGITSSETIQNKSKDATKRHADILVVRCRICKATKRFPIGATRQEGKDKRSQNA